MKLKLRNFSLTSAIVFTSDLSPRGLVVRLQDQQRRMGEPAARWTHAQAEEELAKVEQVQSALEKEGHTLPDAAAILTRARQSLARCGTYRRDGAYSDAYNEAQVTLRALRILMRAHWDQAVRELDTPVASPYAVSFFTLPRHWRFADEIRHARAGQNVLRDGDFESPPQSVPPGWLVQEVPSLDAVVPLARRVTDSPKEGKQCLMLRITPKNPLLRPLVLERTFLAIHTPAVRLPPGTLVRISAWVRIPYHIVGSTDGALLYDSVGGEPLAVRLTAPTPGGGWKKYSLYRRVPESGTLNVTMALTGMGAVYFDDVRIEPLVTPGRGPV
jgi:hypothetical protein